jgi:MFS family permease
MLRASLLVFSTAPLLYLFVGSLWQLALVRFYHGLATAVFVPVALALVADLYSKERGERMGWFSTATLLGRFMAPAAGGGLLALLALEPALGFQAVYALCALSALGAFLLGRRLGPPKESPTGSQQSWAEVLSGFRGVLGHRAILATAAVEAAVLFAYGIFETFLPLHAVRSGVAASWVGAILSAQVLTLALTKPLLGRASDRYGRRPQILLGALLAGAFAALLPWLQSVPALLLVSVLFGLGLSTTTAATSAYIADLSGRAARGSAMGVLGSVMDIGHSTGPLVGGLIASTLLGFKGAFLAALAVLAASAGVFALSGRRPFGPPRSIC